MLTSRGLVGQAERTGRRLGERQRGLSLVEALVGVAIGLFVVAGATALVGGQLFENRRLLLEVQIQQDLRSAADIITRDLRRAGYWSQSEQGVWSPSAAAAPNPFGAVTASSSEVGYSYRRGSGQTGPYGFKLENNTIKTRLAASGWQELTDPRTLRVTAFTVNPVSTPAVTLPCPKLCPDGTQACWPQVTAREYEITITGQAVADATIQRTLSTNVRLRNDYVKFSDLTPTQMCPA